MSAEHGAEESSTEPGVEPIRVLTYFGKEPKVRQLGGAIRAASIEEIESAGAAGAFEFIEPQVTTVEGLARALNDEAPRILHLVSHADPAGGLEVRDIWGDLELTPQTLAQMLDGKNVRAVILNTCYGARIAETLVKMDAVGLAFGYDQKLNFAAALAMAQGFYRGLASGMGPAEAARSSGAWAAARIARENKKRRAQAEKTRIEFTPGVIEVHVHESHRDDPLIGQPDFHIISPDTEEHLTVVDTLVEALSPHRVFHIEQARYDFGGDLRELVDESLRHARVIMLLFEGKRIRDEDLLDEVTTAIAQARKRGVRIFPLHLEGTRADADAYLLDVPYGLRRLVPAYLNDRRIKGDFDKLAEMLKRLLKKPTRRPR